MSLSSTLFWFRQDLRVSDNPGLFEAAKNGPLLPIYILDDTNAGAFKMGAASRWWLHHSLERLNHSLDGKLHIYSGDPLQIITKLLEAQKIDAVYWNRCYEPWRIKGDTVLKTKLQGMGVSCQSFNASLLWEPWEVLKGDQTPYKVFTPFYRHASSFPPRKPLPKPTHITFLNNKEKSLCLQDLKLLPAITWYHGFEKEWEAGELGAHKKLQIFLAHGLSGYKKDRNHPGKKNVSHLSPHLHFGEISPHQAWHAAWNVDPRVPREDKEHFLSELGWREFSYSLLYHFPELPWENFQPKFNHFPWKEKRALLTRIFHTDDDAEVVTPDEHCVSRRSPRKHASSTQHTSGFPTPRVEEQEVFGLTAWQQGKTGYPIVDAGMRELWQTGTMHNRVRMIVASFLVKNLLIHWHHGVAWFWDTLLDADLANNSASWQWVAGSGADAAPYFRIFNPLLQGEKFDPEGSYTLRFVPELHKMPPKFLFQPWEASPEILEKAEVQLGKNYPYPIVDPKQSRNQALEAYHQL